jgi:hypothetical protein
MPEKMKNTPNASSGYIRVSTIKDRKGMACARVEPENKTSTFRPNSLFKILFL